MKYMGLERDEFMATKYITSFIAALLQISQGLYLSHIQYF
jgi:hypothetical protein